MKDGKGGGKNILLEAISRKVGLIEAVLTSHPQARKIKDGKGRLQQGTTQPDEGGARR